MKDEGSGGVQITEENQCCKLFPVESALLRMLYLIEEFAESSKTFA